MLNVDFHLHTTESDGTLTTEQLVRRIAEAALDYFSVTDHDTSAAYQRQPGLLQRHSARLVAGIEVSAIAWDHEVHILAYQCAPQGALSTLIGERPALRRQRVERIIAKLNGLGIAITAEDVLRQSLGSVLGRPHVARALIEAGFAVDVDDAFARYLKVGAPAYVASTTTNARDVIAAIREDGGVSVLAHPRRNDAEAELERLAGCGLQGIEVFSPSHLEHDVDRLRKLAMRHGLVMTAGSDFHGPTDARPRPGVIVEDADIRGFLRLVRPAGGH